MLDSWKRRRWARKVAREIPAARVLHANGVTVESLWPEIEKAYWATPSEDRTDFFRSLKRRQPYLIAALKYVEQEEP